MLTGYCIDCDQCRNTNKSVQDLIFTMPDLPAEGGQGPESLRQASEHGAETEHEPGAECDFEDDYELEFESESELDALTLAPSDSYGASTSGVKLSAAELDATQHFHVFPESIKTKLNNDFLESSWRDNSSYTSDAPVYLRTNYLESGDSGATWCDCTTNQLEESAMQMADKNTTASKGEAQPCQRRKAFLNFTHAVSRGVHQGSASTAKKQEPQPAQDQTTDLPHTPNQQEATGLETDATQPRRLNDMRANTRVADELHTIEGLSTYEHGVVSGTMTPQELDALLRHYDKSVPHMEREPDCQKVLSYLEGMAQAGSYSPIIQPAAQGPHFLGARPDEHIFDRDPASERDSFIYTLKTRFDEIVARKDRLIGAQQRLMTDYCMHQMRQTAVISGLRGTVAALQAKLYRVNTELEAANASDVSSSAAAARGARVRTYSASPIHEKSSHVREAAAEFSPVKRRHDGTTVLQPTVFEGMEAYEERQNGMKWERGRL